MKTFVSAALFAAVIAVEDPLMTKLNDLKNAFAQLATESNDLEEIRLAQATRKSQNLAQVESLAEAEVIAEVIAQVDAAVIAEAIIEADIEAEVDVEAEIEAEVEGHYGESSEEKHTTINVFNGEVENRRRPWQVEKEVCRPQSGVCHPQCPEAIWDRQTQRIMFSWIEDVENCDE